MLNYLTLISLFLVVVSEIQIMHKLNFDLLQLGQFYCKKKL